MKYGMQTVNCCSNIIAALKQLLKRYNPSDDCGMCGWKLLGIKKSNIIRNSLRYHGPKLSDPQYVSFSLNKLRSTWNTGALSSLYTWSNYCNLKFEPTSLSIIIRHWSIFNIGNFTNMLFDIKKFGFRPFN